MNELSREAIAAAMRTLTDVNADLSRPIGKLTMHEFRVMLRTAYAIDRPAHDDALREALEPIVSTLEGVPEGEVAQLTITPTISAWLKKARAALRGPSESEGAK